MGCGRSSVKSLKVIKNKQEQDVPQNKEENEQQQEQAVSLEANEIQKEAFQISQDIYNTATGNADKFQLRNLRQRLQKLDLTQVYAPYNLILNLMQAISSLFINRGEEVNFLAELKHIARLCRILVVHFLGKKSFLTTDHQNQYTQIIQNMKNIMIKTQKVNYDFGFQLEIEIIDKVVKLSQNDQLLRNKLIKKVFDLYSIWQNKDIVAALQFLKDAVVHLEINYLNTDLSEATIDMDIKTRGVELEKKNNYEILNPEKVIQEMMIIFEKHQS